MSHHRPSLIPPPAPSSTDAASERALAAAEVESITIKLRAERRERIIAQRTLKQTSGQGQAQSDGGAGKAEEERADRERQATMDALVAQVGERARVVARVLLVVL